MKIHFDNVNFDARTGPNSFAKILAKEFIRLGYEIHIGDGSKCDVSLVFIERTGMPLASKVIQRLDSIWYSPREYHIKNIGIKSLYKTANHVIFQSAFGERLITNFWDKPKDNTIIRNGASKPMMRDQGLDLQLKQLKQRHELILVTSANWHRQKRLEENIEIFSLIKQKYPSACLIILGSNAQFQQQDGIYYLGSIPYNACIQIYESSDWMIHSCWLDNCPNTVVEALLCDVPIICTDSGGTHELVQDYGIILKESYPYEYNLVEYDEPPVLHIADQFTGVLPERNLLSKAHNVSIEHVAKQYIDTFEKVCNE
jgi:glycosyltransferase involved in cell wall biosynthesis